MNVHDEPARGTQETPVSLTSLVPTGDFVGTVHSVFDTACNLRVGPLLIVVHDVAKAHTPTSVRVSTTGTAPWTPRAVRGDVVSHHDGVLTFGDHALSLHDLTVWTPRGRDRPPRPNSAALRWSSQGRAAVVQTIERARTRSDAADPALTEAVQTLQLAVASSVLGGLDEVTRRRLDETVRRLIGFGPGLTPAGDDVLVGLLAALGQLGGPAAASTLDALHAAVRRSVHRTTDVSAHYLSLAVQGHFSEPLEELIDAITSRAPATALHTRTTEVLSLGSTSGSDTLLGFLIGVNVATTDFHHPHLQEDAA